VTSPSTASYPLAAYNFAVVVNETVMGFREVTGLAAENETITYRDGMSFREGPRIALRASQAWSPVTLRRGTVASVQHLYLWLSARDSRKLQVSLLDAGGKPALTWIAERAVPVRLEAPSFDAATNEVAIESLALLVSGIRVEKA
jgi:phage tail-like protein